MRLGLLCVISLSPLNVKGECFYVYSSRKNQLDLELESEKRKKDSYRNYCVHLKKHEKSKLNNKCNSLTYQKHSKHYANRKWNKCIS